MLATSSTGLSQNPAEILYQPHGTFANNQRKRRTHSFWAPLWSFGFFQSGFLVSATLKGFFNKFGKKFQHDTGNLSYEDSLCWTQHVAILCTCTSTFLKKNT